MINQFSRTELLIGRESMNKLLSVRVAVFGIGGVGGHVCEALIRSGIGKFDLIDNDKVSLTNLNRQIVALHSTVGRYKTEVMKERMLDINPDADIRVVNSFLLPENVGEFPFDEYDYIVDAIDTVAAKIALAEIAKEKNIPIISSMGAGNKLDPTRFKVSDINKTEMDPLARVMRRELKKRGINKLKVVYSDEKALDVDEDVYNECASAEEGKKRIPGSTAFVPSVCGLVIASQVVKDLLEWEK